MARTDVHAPSSVDFDPELYVCYGVQDNQHLTVGNREVLNNLLERGYKRGSSSGQCGHCGAYIRYAALMVREDVREFIYVGQTCLDNRFELTQQDFQRLRKEAKLNAERASAKESRDKLLAEYPALARLDEFTNDYGWNDGKVYDAFIGDVAARFAKTGKLSEKQIEAVLKAIVRYDERQQRAAEREAQKQILIAQGIRVPSGKVAIVGTVVSQKWQESDYGSTLKMVVRSDEGWAVWVTVPDAIFGVEDGERVSFSATVTPSDSDALFGFAKRPTKAKILGAEINHEQDCVAHANADSCNCGKAGN